MPSSLIQASSQQTRFNPSIELAATKRELDLRDVTLTVADHEILSSANIKLANGVRYLLAGQNGVGKSTVLQAIGKRIIPGIPSSLRIVYLEQSEDQSKQGLTSAKSQTVLEHVVASDTERSDALRKKRHAIEDTKDPLATSKVLKQFRRESKEAALEEAKKVADYRSGARGLQARKELKKAEADLEAALQALQIEDAASIDIADSMNEASEMLSNLQLALDAMSADTAEARAVALLSGLGFSAEMMRKPVSALSGGWGMRTQLASVLFKPCDILLLDEPSNFLDFTSLLWLQDYLANGLDPDVILVLVSHDRAFADAVVNETLILRDKTLLRFPGTLSAFFKERQKQKLRMTRMKEAQDKQVAHMEKSVANFRKSAREAGDEKKLKQAASRQKKLDERMGVQVSAKGGRFKLNRDHAGFHNSARAAIEIPQDEAVSRFQIISEPPELRFPGPLLACENLTFKYKKAVKPIIQEVNLTIRLGETVALLGPNGAGKSTLVGCLVDQSGMSAKGTMTGTVTKHTGATIGYYSQAAIDELPGDETALQYIKLGTEQESRSALAHLGLSGRTVSDIPISQLSGGQKVRTALAKILFPHPPHVLVLDEVTTHLDADTVQNLTEQLRAFQGAIIVVSHDRWFVNALTSDENDDSEEEDDTPPASGTVYMVDRSKLKPLPGGIAQFEERVRKRASIQAKKAQASSA